VYLDFLLCFLLRACVLPVCLFVCSVHVAQVFTFGRLAQITCKLIQSAHRLLFWSLTGFHGNFYPISILQRCWPAPGDTSLYKAIQALSKACRNAVDVGLLRLKPAHQARPWDDFSCPTPWQLAIVPSHAMPTKLVIRSTLHHAHS